MIGRLDKLSKDAPLDLITTLHCLEKQTFKAPLVPPWDELNMLLCDFASHHEEVPSKIMIVLGNKGYPMETHNEKYLVRSKGYDFDYHQWEKDWAVRIRQLLSHQKPLTGANVEAIVSAVMQYSEKRWISSLPFIWHAILSHPEHTFQGF